MPRLTPTSIRPCGCDYARAFVCPAGRQTYAAWKDAARRHGRDRSAANSREMHEARRAYFAHFDEAGVPVVPVVPS